jgi:outer membrane biosynthesis protein TonB
VSEPDREDDLLKRFLERRSEVNEVYRRVADEQPPRALDAEILAASREALADSRRRKSWAMRWGAPLAAAAVLALAVAIGVQLRDQADLALDRPPMSRTAPPAPPAEALAKRSQSPQLDEAAKPPAARKKAQSPQNVQPQPAPSRTAGEPRNPEPKRETARAEEQRPSSPGAPAASKERPATAAAASQGARDDQRSPEAAAAAIRAAYDRGEREQADRQLRQFCRDYPGYSVPAELRQHAVRLSPDCELPAGEP